MEPAIAGNQEVPANPQSVLGHCLVDGDTAASASGRRRRGKALGISFAIETAAVALLVMAPLLTGIAKPSFSNPSFVPILFGISHLPDARERRSTAIPAATHIRSVITFSTGHIPERALKAMHDEGNNIASIEGWVPGPSDAGTLPFSGLLPANPEPQPPGSSRKPEDKSPMKVSEGVELAQLISRIEPRYPILALQVKREGTVMLHAIIGRDGRISELDVMSGSPLFVRSALDAVRQWRYRPTLLNGEPVEVETTITVIFQLQQ